MKNLLTITLCYFLFSQVTNSQIVDTTLTINAKHNCLLLSDTTKININSVVVGFEEGLEVGAAYQLNLSGKAYFFFHPELDFNPETSTLPLPIIEIPGIFLLFVSEKGTEYRYLAVNDSLTFVPDRSFLYAFLADRFSIEDNNGIFELRIKKVE